MGYLRNAAVAIGIAAVAALSVPPLAVADTATPGALVVSIDTTVRADVEIDDADASVTHRVVKVSINCAGVAVGPRLFATSATCLDTGTFAFTNRLRDAAIEGIPGVTTSEVLRLQAKARSEDWRVSAVQPGASLQAEIRIHRRDASGTVGADPVQVTSAVDPRLAILRSQAPLDSDYATPTTETPAAGAVVRVGAFDVDAVGTSRPAKSLLTRTVRSASSASLAVDDGFGPSSLGAPVFDDRGRLVGLVTGDPTRPAMKARTLIRALAAVAAPTTSAMPSSTPAPSSVPVLEEIDRQVAEDFAATSIGPDAAPSEPLSTWAMVAIAVGVLDVFVLIAVVIVFARRRH